MRRINFIENSIKRSKDVKRSKIESRIKSVSLDEVSNRIFNTLRQSNPQFNLSKYVSHKLRQDFISTTREQYYKNELERLDAQLKDFTIEILAMKRAIASALADEQAKKREPKILMFEEVAQHERCNEQKA